jgi:sugar phosphate permease
MNTTWITLVVVALVVVRFLFRELRARKIRVRTLWIRPGILAVITLVLIGFGFAIPRVSMGVVALSVVVGAVFGIGVGVLVARMTTFAPAGERGAVIAHGSMKTVIVWVAAIVLRLLARFAFAGAGATPAEQYELNAGLLALVTAAFIVVAVEFHRAIDRLAPETPTATARTV